MPSLHWCFTIKKPKEVKDFDPTAKANFWSDILALKLNGGLSPWTTGVKKKDNIISKKTNASQSTCSTQSTKKCKKSSLLIRQ